MQPWYPFLLSHNRVKQTYYPVVKMLQVLLSVLFQWSSQCENKEDQSILNIKNYVTDSRSDRNEGFRTKVPETLTDRVKLSYISVSWPYSKYKWNHEPLEEDKEVRERERRWMGNQWTVNNVTRNVLAVFEYVPVWLRKKNENTEQTLLPIPSLHYKLPFVCDSSSLSKSCPLVVKRGSMLSCPWILL